MPVKLLKSKVSRRTLLQSAGFSLAWHATLPANQIYGKTGTSTISEETRHVVVYADSAHYSTNPALAPFIPPSSYAHATQRYIESLGHNEFLTRHWFA